jgi:translocation and assembly module TamA
VLRTNFLRPIRTLLLALALGTASSSFCADLPATAGDTSAPSAPRPFDPVKYRVTVNAPPALAAVIARSVDLVRWQQYDDMDEELLDRLARDAVGATREAAATLGFFSADVEVSVDRKSDPVAVALNVTPGEPTRIASVRIAVAGPAATDVPVGTDAIAKVEREWTLPRGEIFQQSVWDAAKDQAVGTLAASPFAAAALVHSEALIDPAQRTAALTVDLTSGPAFRFGAIEVTGLSHYSAELVRSFSTMRPGDLYSRSVLDDYIRRLLVSGYFASVQATIDTNPERAQDTPVTLNVIEAPSKRIELGAGFSTDTKFRISANYSDMNIDERALQFYADARIESNTQSANVRFVRPPTPTGWIDSLALGLVRTDIENLTTRTAAAVVRRQGLAERNMPAFSIGYFYDEQQPEGGEQTTSHALYAEGEYTWRRVDDLLSPTRGYMTNVSVGGGVPGVSTKGFGRVVGKFAAWWPIDRQYSLTGRAEAGAVIADSRDGIPSTFLFRTGGDTTVRGYAFESLGVKQDNATVGGRYYFVASTELTRWFNETWGIATFVDAGNAVDSLHGVDVALGYGVGARLRTPIGPFRVDLAYGQQSHSVRLHFSVGLSF